LRRIDARAAIPELSRLAIEDPSYEVRVQAVRALGETGAPEVTTVLDAALVDENEFVRAATANARKLHAAAAARSPLERPVQAPPVSPPPTATPVAAPRPAATPTPTPEPTATPTPTPEPTAMPAATAPPTATPAASPAPDAAAVDP
jgi:outer membrane biosynthesis protein TonB